MTALDRLLTLQRQSTDNRLNAETNAATQIDGNVSVVVTGTDTSGRPIGRTANGGTLTLDNPSGQFIPEGSIAQATTSNGGTAQVNLPGAQAVQASQVSTSRRIIYKLRAPVAGQDIGFTGYMWIHEKPEQVSNGVVPADLYVWSANQGVYVLASSPIVEQNGYIEAPAVQSYPIIHSARYPSEIIGLYGSAGTTANLSVANNTPIAIGDSVDLVVTVTDGNPYSFTVEYRRL